MNSKKPYFSRFLEEHKQGSPSTSKKKETPDLDYWTQKWPSDSDEG